YQLTHGDWDHFDPRWSPDGEWIAYISNQRGVSDLRLLRVVGGEDRVVEIRRRVYRRPMGALEVHMQEPTRIYLRASDGKTYVPPDAYQRVSNRQTRGDYFHAARHFLVDVPAGEVTLEAVKGIEYWPLQKTVTVKPGSVAELQLDPRRMIHMN